MKKLLFTFTFLFSSCSIANLKPYYAEYNLYWNGVKVAYLNSSLEKINNIFIAKTSAKSTLFFLNYKENETSKFKLENKKIIPIEYSLISSKNKNKIQTVKNKLDKINHLFQLNIDLANNKILLKYNIAKPNKISKYTYKILNKETIETNLGKLDTIKIVNYSDSDKNKHTIIWLCPKLNNIIVKTQQFKKNKMVNELIISKLNW